MLKKYFIMAITAIFALVACSEKFDEPGIQPAGSDNVHTLSVGIEAGTYTPAEGGTKASMEAVIRVNWTEGDKVSVVNATTEKILEGYLEAKASGTSVTFEGTVTGTINQNDKLYYIYPKLDAEAGAFADAGYDQKLSGQKYDATKPNEVCFFGYAEDVAGTATISKKIQFNLVTAYAHLNMSNLPAKGAPLTSIDISNVNEGFTWKLSGGTLSAEPYAGNNGISVTCTNNNITPSGNAVVRFALPASGASQQAREITVNKAYKNDGYTVKELEKASYHNQLYSSWESNVSVTTEASKTKVSITTSEGSTDVAEGVIPVADAFVADKETEIGIGGVGIIKFDETATNKIKNNAGSADVFFKVEDVTNDTDVQNKNIVYEVTMKTVDEKGVEVFADGKADGVATVSVPLGEEVDEVTNVALVNESGVVIEGGVVPKSVHFENGILTFQVNHFSKYAINYTTKEITAVAEIGGRKYETLASAIAAAQNGNTIQMIADFATTDKVTVGADKNIILDLNGKTISYTTDEHGSFIENRGQLKIKDSGSNGIITAKFSAPNWSDGCYTINNAGTYENASKLVIESGTIENTSPASGLAWPISNGVWGTYADLVINGGTIHSTNYVPVREYLQYGGKKTIVINGGKFISDNSRAIAVQVSDATIKDTGSSVTINGGEFTCKGSGILYIDLHAANVNMTGFAMTVNGGKFSNSNTSAPVLVYDEEGNSQASAVLLNKILKGGTYSQKPASELLADGYAVKQNTDGSWTVEIENFWPNFAASSFSNINEGAKTITISSPAELALLAKKINGGTSYAGYTISINGSLDMGAHYWIPINAYSKGSISGATIMGENSATIANLKIEKAIYKGNYDYYAGFIAQAAGGVTFKDLTFSGAVSVDNGSGVATVLGQTYGNVLFDNVKVVNSTVSAETKAGSLLGFTGGDGIKVTVKDCSLDNVTVKAEYSYALMVGLVNTNDQVVFEGSNTATNSHAVLDETIASSDFPTRKTIKGYTYGVDNTKLWVIGVQDAWAECRTNPTPTKTIDDVEYSVMGDIFYHADGVVVDVCAPDPVAKIGNTKYATLDEAFAAVQTGQTIEIIQAGSYAIPSPINNITVKGADNLVTVADDWGTHPTVVFDASNSSGQLSSLNGVVFSNIKFLFSGNGYTGFQHQGATVTFNNCDFEGLFNGYGNMIYNNCYFKQTTGEYVMWTYGSRYLEFNKCGFDVAGKALHAYQERDGENNHIIKITDCKFFSSVANKPALVIKNNGDGGPNTSPIYYDVTITNSTFQGFGKSSKNDLYGYPEYEPYVNAYGYNGATQPLKVTVDGQIKVDIPKQDPVTE